MELYSCKVCVAVGRGNGTTSTPECPPSRVPLLIFLLIFLVVSIASRSTQQLQVATQDNNTYCQPSSCYATPVHTSFIFFYHSLYALILSIHSPSPAPLRSPLRYKILDSTLVYKRILLLIKDGIMHRPSTIDH